MVLRFSLFALLFLFVSCSDMKFNNPYDPDSSNWIGNSSSSAETVPGSSSSKPSSSSVAPAASSSSSVPVQSGIVYGKSVNYQGETYQTVLIGSQVWFKRNLNYNVSGSKCYGEGGKLYNYDTGLYDKTLSTAEIQANCDEYGRLYKWSTAMALPDSCNGIKCTSIIGTKHKGICPSGWHIPSDDDWATLANFVGASTAGTKLKATSGWNNYNGKSGNGQDTYGFAALPGGFGNSDGSFANAGGHGLWWSASENDANVAYYRRMYYDIELVYRGSNHKGNYLFSVRCLQD